MADIINVLPDSVANQIAAGEVIQRPASVVKELMENAVDAGATSVEVIIKHAGRTLIQVIDNGCGMSETDARLSFERHATSKIKCADDLFHLHTKGFRGEALASIAAIAHVEMHTKTQEAEIGTAIFMEACKCTEQNACPCNNGTSISVKNLFFNVPARRNFLKSDNVEFGHIQEEFIRIALVHPQITFKLYHNDKVEYNLPVSMPKQRIINIFGSNYNEKLIPVEQNSDVVHISGYVTKPEYARKSKGGQYFFVNQRFMKHSYFHHAVVSAFESLVPENTTPGYFLYFELNPEKIDVNIHPTKTEIKFVEEKYIYSILHAAVKHSIGTYDIRPSLEFGENAPIEFTNIDYKHPPKEPITYSNPDYNPFDKSTFRKSASADYNNWKPQHADNGWDKIYDSLLENTCQETAEEVQTSLDLNNTDDMPAKDSNNSPHAFQVLNKYIVGKIKSGFVVIDPDAAMERILYEQYLTSLEKSRGASQKLLFPETVHFTPHNAATVKDLLPEFIALGFEMEEFGKTTFIITGIPCDCEGQDIQKTMDYLLDTYNNNLLSLKISKKNNLAHSFARSIKKKDTGNLHPEEMQHIIYQLFCTQSPQISPSGKKIFVIFDEKELLRIFQ
ncbi:MAG: DNA mismatch repair endonuclease MutL [Bacteroidales bacterium]|nr:DNA mismatch repair endonuclease MutL [Bacteroidales bacterium]